MGKTIFPFLEKGKQKGKPDLFNRTQGRLTLAYSGMLMVFLLLFVFIVYGILYVVINEDQERELREQEGKVIESYLHKTRVGGMGRGGHENAGLTGRDQFFYYVVDASGEVVMGAESFPGLRSKFLRLLDNWDAKKDIEKKSIQVDENDWNVQDDYNMDGPDLKVPHEKQKVHLMIASRPIQYEGQNIGTLFVGRDITVVHQLLTWILIILGALAVLFSGVAYYISYIMSKKAMVPISKAFSRQREFVADASHELRTPLSVMQSSLDAMEMTMDTQRDDFSYKLLFSMKDEVKRMTCLVGDLLTLARSDSVGLQLRNESLELREISEKAIDSLASLAADKDINLKLESPPSILINGDRDRITQLIYILLDNAIKYTDHHGEAALKLEKTPNELMIKVQDNGIGISPEDQKQIFSRFYRADKARSREMGSHGLGLAIAKWIVEMHKGSIEVESTPGAGSTFTVRLPAGK
ncbi:sensor histidine kinase [Peribacillus kribbensis]|uniref:sensor histidine kinase n=1 Tax=Peribacillus kribbensis TaxID=356658 RepID=UPI00041C3142|nr:ATP-binding protein [Peribacillus kribbensis]